jgi:hypothetical protein
LPFHQAACSERTRSLSLIDPDLPMATAHSQAIICTILAGGRFGHMLKIERTRPLPCGGRIAHPKVDN